jgi:protein-disulfide isomerase
VANSTNTGSGDGLTKAQRRAQRAEQQRAELAARKRKDTTRRVVLTSTAVVALVALVAVLVVVGRNHNSNGGDGTTTASGIPKIGTTKYGLTVGDPKAPHQLIIYEDFLCPYCGHLELESEAKLQAEAKAGKVYIDYRPFNLLAPPQDSTYSARALNAFIAVKEIAGDDAALTFHNLLYHNQPEEPGPGDDTAGLIKLADQAVPQADRSKVAAAITNNTYSSAVQQVTSDVEQGAGISGTPTVYFDGKTYSDTSGTHTDAFAAYENMADNLIAAVK